MTNNPTIDGVSRERQQFEAENGHRAWFVAGGRSDEIAPEGFVYGDFTTDMCWTCYFQASANQQSTIARLEARITQLESEAEFAASTYQAARDRIAELESGGSVYDPENFKVQLELSHESHQQTLQILGRPVFQVRSHGSVCWEDVRGESIELFQSRLEEYEMRKIFIADPSPVSAVEKYDEVLLPFLSLMRAELHANAHKGDRQGWLQMDSKTAILEVFYHMGKLHQAVHRGEEAAIKEYAADVANMCMMLLDVCDFLDATAALNKSP